MAVTVGTTIAGTVADPTGIALQGHLTYAVNDAAWWFFYVGSSSTTTILAYRSPDLTTWTSKTASGAFASSYTNNGNGGNLGVAYKNISSNDVFHFCLAGRISGTTDAWQHCRATVSSGTVTWGSWALGGTTSVDDASCFPAGAGCVLDSNNKPWDGNDVFDVGSSGACAARATNADIGSSWTAGFGSETQVASVNDHCKSTSFYDLGSGNVLMLYDNGAGSGGTLTMKNVNWSKWNGTSWGAGAAIFTALVTAVAANNFAAYGLSTTDVHCILRTAATTFTHKRFNGTNWTSVSGAAIPSQQNKAGAGLALSPDGLGNLYLFVVDDTTGASCKIQYCKWTSASNTWGSWTQLEAGNGTLNFITANYGNGNVGVSYAKTNGSNFDVLVSTLTLSTPTITPIIYPYVSQELFNPLLYQE